MKKSFLVMTLALSTSLTSQAQYDEFSCETNPNLELAHLQCISCGLTQHYAKKGISVNPSHKWLALLAIQAREQGFTADSNNVLKSDIAREKLQKAVIRQVQLYGFCNDYLGKKTVKNGRSKNYHDVSAEEWHTFFEFLNREKVPSAKSYAELAETMGFKDPGFFTSGTAKTNMSYLFEGAFESLSIDEKRALFKEKLNQALAPEYNVSGEKVENSREFIASGDDDQGLRKCLADIRARNFQATPSDKETFELCENLAKSCELSRTPKNPNNDFCILKGMALDVPSLAKPGQPTPPPPSAPSSITPKSQSINSRAVR